MKILHIVAGLEESNGMANTARQFAAEERAKGYESAVTNDLSALDSSIDVVHLHGAWLPILWRAAKRAKRLGAKLVIRPAGSYDPVRLAYHGWKKRLVSFFEHRMLLRADVVLATCQAEVEWIRKYEPRVKKIEVTDVKRFFVLSRVECTEGNDGRVEGVETERVRKGSLHLLYLGRRHPLKGLEFLEEALEKCGNVKAWKRENVEAADEGEGKIEFRVESNVFGEEKERMWEWCDVLVLPTLSENFGLVIAEALERGKRVITTDGAPAWGDGNTYGGRLVYLKGYLNGSREERISLLESAIANLSQIAGY
jgi:glycosyltransferase involved in cell wall biosynthesis